MIKLSVIIPTRNRAKSLDKLLNTLTQQTLGANFFEVIVVDNGSSDNTKEVVLSYKNKLKNLVYNYQKEPGLHVGRHAGLRTSKANFLVYADDDIEASHTWLEGVLETFENYNAVLVGGKVLPKFESEPPSWILQWWKRDNMIGYLSIIDLGDSIKEINPLYVFGCNFSIRKDILVEAGGFHPDGMPKELIKYRGDGETYVSRYIQNKGYKAIYNPKALVYHFVPNSRMTNEYFRYRAFLQGISNSYTDIREGNKRSIIKFNLKLWIKKLIGRDIEFEKAYLDGYLYHQSEARKDKELMKWILKETYMEVESDAI